VTKELGMAEVIWSVDTLDWKYPNAPRLRGVVLGSARRGSIILMHDAINRSTIDAIPTIVEQLQRRGFQLVTVSELFGNHIVPGKIYLHGAASSS
jgi:peptidoglycan-N-acetylglucosamine deacetylase